MKQTEIKRMLPSRSENNPEDGEEEKKEVEESVAERCDETGKKGVGYGFSLSRN